MLVSHKHKFIFIHVPTTGGSSIRKALSSFRDEERRMHKHYPLDENIKLYSDIAWQGDLNDYYKFTIVRNPWHRLLSIWRYSTKGVAWKGWPNHSSATPPSFKDFVYYAIQRSKMIKEHDLERPQPSRAIDQRFFLGNTKFNFIGRTESLAEDFKKICEEIGLTEIELPHMNRSTRAGKNKDCGLEMYDEEIVKALLGCEIFRKQLNYFGYSRLPEHPDKRPWFNRNSLTG